jgi:hypothetical protein
MKHEDVCADINPGCAREFGEIRTSLDSVTKLLERLDHSMHGNGQPGLKDRIGAIETRSDSNCKWLYGLSILVGLVLTLLTLFATLSCTPIAQGLGNSLQGPTQQEASGQTAINVTSMGGGLVALVACVASVAGIAVVVWVLKGRARARKAREMMSNA